jgi:V-type ATPase 116 kDa subunit
MAIEKFKLLTIVAPVESFDHVVTSTVLDSSFQVEEADKLLYHVTDKLQPFEFINPYDSLLRKSIELATTFHVDLNYESFQNKEWNLDQIAEFFSDFGTTIRSLKEQQVTCVKTMESNTQILKKLKYIENIDMSLDELLNCKYTKFRFGRISNESYERFKEYLSEDRNVFFIPTSTSKHHVYGMYFTTQEESKTVDSFFASLNFERIWIPGEHGKPKEAYSNIQAENERLKKKESELGKQIKGYLNQNRKEFLACYSYLKFYHTAYELRKFARKTEEMFFLVGWIPQDKFKEFTKKLEKLDIQYATDQETLMYLMEEPEEVKNSAPPTKLNNKGFFRFFEQFVTMYGLPSYNELDPTPFVAITYTLLFGIMFGDIGQGLVLAIGGFLFYRWKKLKLARIISVVGLSSTFFGILYGSVFGSEDLLPGFKAMENGNTINITLMTAIVLGVLIITIAMVINIINGFKQKDMEKALFSPNGFAGMVFYWAIIIGVLLLMGKGINVFSVLYIILFAVLPLILMFLREPLGNLISGNKAKVKNKGEYAVENLFELFEVLLSYITNTISFVRVGAFALNHAGMMLAVYILAQTAAGTHNPVVLVLGNILVIGLEGLIVGIQVLRLEFYEIFSRFYSGEGKEYKPLTVDYQTKNI